MFGVLIYFFPTLNITLSYFKWNHDKRIKGCLEFSFTFLLLLIAIIFLFKMSTHTIFIPLYLQVYSLLYVAAYHLVKMNIYGDVKGV